MRIDCWTGVNGASSVMRGLKIQICDSECRDRSANIIVYVSGTVRSGVCDSAAGKVAAKRQ